MFSHELCSWVRKVHLYLFPTDIFYPLLPVKANSIPYQLYSSGTSLWHHQGQHFILRVSQPGPQNCTGAGGVLPPRHHFRQRQNCPPAKPNLPKTLQSVCIFLYLGGCAQHETTISSLLKIHMFFFISSNIFPLEFLSKGKGTWYLRLKLQF